MPDWLRPVVAKLMPVIGPRGLEFARARVEMKAIDTVLRLQREVPGRARHMIPRHKRALAANYGIHDNGPSKSGFQRHAN